MKEEPTYLSSTEWFSHGMGYEMEKMKCCPIRTFTEMWVSTWIWGIINTHGSVVMALQLCFVLLGRRHGEGPGERQWDKLLSTTLRKKSWWQYSKRASRSYLRTVPGSLPGDATAWNMPKTSQCKSEFLGLVISYKKFKWLPNLQTKSVLKFLKGVKPFYHWLAQKWFILPGQLRLPPDR